VTQRSGAHDLVELLERAPGPRSIYFDRLLGDDGLKEFLHSLTNAYLGGARYGEVAWGLNFRAMYSRLDELVSNLDRAFRELEPQAGRRLYVPKALRSYVLDENKFFTEEDVTDNGMAIFGQLD